MSIYKPEIEIVDKAGSIRYLEHGWPTPLCRWHAHEEYELHLIVSTTGNFFVGDHIGRFKPGQLIMTGPMVPHNWVTDGSFAGERIEQRDMLIQFDHATLAQGAMVFPEFAQLRDFLALSVRGVEFASFDTDEARSRLESIRDSSGLTRLANFLALLDRLRLWPEKQSLSSMRQVPLMRGDLQDSISRAVEHVIANYGSTLDIDTLAKVARLTPKSFSTHFRRLTGKRPSEFINKVRIGQACILLLETDGNIQEISRKVGYTSVANFNRNFLQIMAMSPREFRKSSEVEQTYPHKKAASGGAKR